MNFMIETAIALNDVEYAKYEGPAVSNRFTTNNVVDFSNYLNGAIEYYRGMVQFEKNVNYVAMLVQTYRDHHTIHITLDEYGKAKVTTNQ